MSNCRHNKTRPCEWCLSQDFVWHAGCRCDRDRITNVEIGGRTFVLREGFKDPSQLGYWLWPCSVLLAEEIAAREETESWTGKTVLELGPGLGLPGMVAAALGASVTYAEADPGVRARLRDNLDDNDLTASIHLGTWADLNCQFDAIVGSEMLYSKELVIAAADCVRSYHTGKGPAIFTEADREPRWVERYMPLRGVILEKEIRQGRMKDGRSFSCNLWTRKVA